ncbi:MAG: hypothetical protein JXA13_11680 [Anaerolineales bacterium]|nr:hypothetical protein [Anaerolineales bacterium]
MYQKLAGMTGTALTEAEEFSKIYELEVLPIPTNLEFQAFGQDASLIAKKDRDEDGYEYTYYVRPDDPPEAEPVLWKRKDYPDVIYRTLEAKLRAIVREIVHYHVLGRPMLVGTTSVESSELLSERLRAEPVRRMMQVLLVRRAWLLANDRFEDGRLIPELQTFNAPLDKVSPAELRQFAKPLNISINVEDPENISALLEILDLPAASSERLKMVMQAGVVHNVLNARRHAEESQIIAGAGEFGAVTIATNMAGRGVDIKLGGDLAEEIFGAIHRVLRRIDVDPYESTLEEQRQALLKADPSVFGIYEAEVQLFLSYFDDMEKVKTLGGLHVIGSERHEARRIDNQLRGRAARQGDPGSSRFYLSLEDDLMRMFGGEQVNNMMLRFSLDDSLPLENRMVGNIIEQSQHRVEGANFDGRKHLLEYDDVLNSQRERIYSQRNRVFTKEYLGDDIQIMLRAEVEKRVPAALEDPEGPWRLIAWLEQIQPPILAGDHLYPSFGMRLILESLENTDDFYTSAVEVISEAIRAEQERILDAIQVGIDRTGEALEMQIEERYEGLEIFLEGLNDSEEGLRAQEVSEQLTAAVQLQLQLSNTQLRTLLDEPYSVEDDLRKAIRGELTKINAERLIGSIEYRLKQSLELDIRQIDQMTWKEIAGSLFEASQMVLEQQRETLVGEKGSVTRDLEGARTRETASNLAADARLRLLMSLAQGVRTGFDTRTHQQVKQIYSRFNYIFLAAQYLENSEVETLSAEVLEHLEGAQENLQLALGLHEWTQKTQNASRLADLGPAAAVLEEDRAAEPPFSLSEEDRQIVIKELGRLQLNELQRQLLLRAITEQWVDYLTKVEALRVSIGLEAYGQRDPLVQYKGRASEMFQQLLGDIRAQVIGRVFLYRPLRPGTSKGEGGEVRAVNALQPGKPIKKEKKSKKKRKRH